MVEFNKGHENPPYLSNENRVQILYWHQNMLYWNWVLTSLQKFIWSWGSSHIHIGQITLPCQSVFCNIVNVNQNKRKYSRCNNSRKPFRNCCNCKSNCDLDRHPNFFKNSENMGKIKRNQCSHLNQNSTYQSRT